MDQGRSHATSFNAFMHRLQQDNHTTALEFAKFHPDIDFGMEEKFIDMDGFQNPFSSPDFDKIAFEEDYSFIHQAVAYGFGSETCNNILNHKREKFFDIVSEDWDLYLSDSLFAVCGYGMAEISGKPHVMMHSTDLESAQGSFKGFSRNYATFVPSNLPFTMLDFSVSKYSHRVWAAYDWFGSYIFTAIVGNFAQKWVEVLLKEELSKLKLFRLFEALFRFHISRFPSITERAHSPLPICPIRCSHRLLEQTTFSLSAHIVNRARSLWILNSCHLSMTRNLRELLLLRLEPSLIGEKPRIIIMKHFRQ